MLETKVMIALLDENFRCSKEMTDMLDIELKVLKDVRWQERSNIVMRSPETFMNKKLYGQAVTMWRECN